MELDRGYTMETLEKIFISFTIMSILTFAELLRIITVFSWPFTVWNYVELFVYFIIVMFGWYVIVKESLR